MAPDAWEVADDVAEDDRRVRRRRQALAVVGVVAVVVAGAATAFGPLRHHEVATGGGLADPVTWSRGSTLHAGPDTIRLGFEVHGFVRTSAGFVAMDEHRAVWSVTDAGQRRVGEVGVQQRLVADRHGPLAAWVGPAGDLLVLDQLAGTVHRYPDPSTTGDDSSGALAMDGRTVYWRTSGGLVAVDTTTGRQTRVADARLQLFDVKGSVLAFADATRDLKVGTSLASARPLVAWSLDPHGGDEPVTLSPTGRWVAVAHIRVSGSGDDQEIEAHLNVYDVGTQAVRTLHLPGGPWVAVPSVWLGDATLQVLGLFGDPPLRQGTVDPTLFSCRLPSGSCERVVTVGRVGTGTSVSTLPDGRWSSTP